MIEINGSSPTIQNSILRESDNEAIYATSGGSPNIGGNDFLGNDLNAVKYIAPNESTGEINIHGNYVEGGSTEITVTVESGASVTGKTLSGNTVIGTEGTGVYYKGSDIPGDITENTLSENKYNRISVEGTVAHSSTWGTSPGGTPLWLPSTLTVASEATLTVDPGVKVIGGDDFSRIFVNGTLKAEGTSESPIVFTSANSEEAGEWRGLVFEPGSGSSVLDHVEVAYGGHLAKPMIEINGSSPTIQNSILRESDNEAIKIKNSGAPLIERNRFRANSKGLSYTGTGNLSAPNNDWGCASGPSPAGCGDSVTSNVKWEPAVQLPELSAQCRGDDTDCAEGADPVSLATGSLNYSHRDLLLTNKSEMPLAFTRSYFSGSESDTGLGPGWSQTGLSSATELESGTVLILRADGRQDSFYKVGEAYKSPSGVTDVLSKVEGTFRLTTLEDTVYEFDGSGRIAKITDDHGLETTYGYNASGRLATITDPSAQTLTFSYNASNHITKVTDSTGREVKYTYTAGNELKTVTDALGGVTEYAYDGDHRLKTITDPRENVILQNTYDGQGRIVEQLDGSENLWTLEYKEGETIVTEPEGGEIAYGFDEQGRQVSETDQLGHTTTTSYDEAGLVDEVLRPGGAKWTYGYDEAGNLTSVTDPEEGERGYEYDGQNHLIAFTDQREKTWEYEWDEDNDLVKVTDPAEGETTFTHDEAGLPLTVTDPEEHTTTFTYDGRGNRLTVEDALEHVTSFGYDSRNHLTSETKPGLEPAELGRNSLGDLTSRTTPEGHETQYAYDANGGLVKVTDPSEGVWQIVRDAMERPTAYVDPLEGETKVEYDGNLNPVTVTDRRGKQTSYEYDAANQLTEILRPEGGDWEFGYDARGNRTEAVEPRENATIYEYDLLNRMTKVTEPLEAVTSYGYDASGNLTSITDPRENTTELVYDDLDRLTAIEQPLEKTTGFTYDGVGLPTSRTTAEGTVEFGYDAANRLQEVSAGEATLRSFGYDSANRMTSATDAQEDEIEIGYDEDGHVTSIDDGRGQTVSREYDSRGNLVGQEDGRGVQELGYDALNRMTSLVDPQEEELGFKYDASGNVTEVELPNGVVTTNEYDDAGRLAKTTSKLGEATLESLEYEYDEAGNRVGQVDRLSQETSYGYDALNRLTEFDPPGEGSTEYGYDLAGNRTEAGGTTFGFDALNQLTEDSGGRSYEYDDAGRLAQIEESEEATTTYSWNPFDELTGVEAGEAEVAYTYDALGRRASRDDGTTFRATHYGDPTDRAILETDAEGEVTGSYVQGPWGLAEQRSEGATAYPLRDAHGDIATIADAEGEVASRQAYDPWGDQLSGPELEMGWLGAQQRPTDTATGLVQMGVRAYEPGLGRFLSEDPVLPRIGLGATANLYGYAWDRPLDLYDLNGRDVCVFGGCAGDVIDAGRDAVEWGQDQVSSAQEYWVESDSPVSYVAGPLVSIVDLAINPGRLDYYIKSHPWPQKEQLADCYNGGHPARTIGSIAGGAGGFVAGVSSARDLGVRAVGVGAISGPIGYKVGGGIGALGGCALGLAGGLIG